MKLGAILTIGALIIAVICAGSLFSTYTGTHDKAVKFESNIKRLNDASKSQLSNFTLTLRDKAQIPEMYTKDLQSVIGTYFEGRGKQDITMVKSFMQQHMPKFDTKLYEDLMITINAGRAEFNNIQQQKIDQCADYQAFRQGFWSSKFMPAQYPSRNIEKLCQVISDGQTNEAFETGVQESIKLR